MRRLFAIGVVAALLCWGALSGAKGATEQRSLLMIPSPDVLSEGSFKLAGGGKTFTEYPGRTPRGLARMGCVWTAEIGLFGFAEFGASMNNAVPGVGSAAGRFRVRLLRECDYIPGLAVGGIDITGNEHPVEYTGYPVGSEAYFDHPENNSFYAVLRKGIATFGRAYAGIGTGRFLGRGPNNKKLSGAFGGGELFLTGTYRLLAELDGRNGNAGVGAAWREINIPGGMKLRLTAAIWGLYLQNLRNKSNDLGLRPGITGNIGIEVGVPISPTSGAISTSKPAPVELRPREIKFGAPVSEWRIEISGPSGTVVRTIAGVGLPPKALKWDGLDDRGAIVPNQETVKIRLVAKEASGKEMAAPLAAGGHASVLTMREATMRRDYQRAMTVMESGSTEEAGKVLERLVGRPTADGKPSLAQVRACELLAVIARNAGKEGTARAYAAQAAARARQAGLATYYKTERGDNLWNLAGSLLGDYRLWTLIYEANLEVLRDARNVPAGITLRIPSDLLDEDYARAIKKYIDTPFPYGFKPG